MKNHFLIYLLLFFGLFLSVVPQTEARRSYVRSHSTYHYSRSSSAYHHRTYHGSKYYSSGKTGYSRKHPYKVSSGRHKSTYALGVRRDAHGKIKRSSSARHEFMVKTGYPHGRPGYVIDHIIPLKRGGSDTPDNMQWQTKAEAKAKDKWE
ncbi:MAG: HNH endonuclease signature motif containing protein [Microbacter sp.]